MRMFWCHLRLVGNDETANRMSIRSRHGSHEEHYATLLALTTAFVFMCAVYAEQQHGRFGGINSWSCKSLRPHITSYCLSCWTHQKQAFVPTLTSNTLLYLACKFANILKVIAHVTHLNP